MKLYDNTILRIKNLLSNYEMVELPSLENAWAQSSKETMILRKDMAYELGGDLLPALGCTIITANQSLAEEDKLYLVGKDLGDIKKDSPYARISIVRVDEATLGEGEKLYKAIRDLEFTRYHFFPEGFMMRVSASRGKESVRISKDALKKEIDFAKIGSQLRDAFHQDKKVLAVETYYVTLEDFDYKALEKCMKESEEITKTIDHIMKNVIMDCEACSLQKVCEEVEGMRELHFKK